MAQPNMSCEQADRLSYYLQGLDGVSGVKVFERTADAVVCYTGEREALLTAVRKFHYEEAEVPRRILKHSGRQLSRMYQEKLMKRSFFARGVNFVPYPLRAALISVRAVRYIVSGIRSLAGGRLDVEVLDAAAIGVSILRSDFKTAGSVMFLLGIGEILEEWTHKNRSEIWRGACLSMSAKCGNERRSGDSDIRFGYFRRGRDRRPHGKYHPV